MTEAFESPSTLTNSSCNPNSNFSYSTDPNFLASFPEKTISVYFWAINRTDGTSDNPFDNVKLQESMNLLNSEFAEMNLCFELKGFEEINDDNIYFNSAGTLSSYTNQNPNKVDQNSVNIYIPFKFTNFNNNLRGFMFGFNKMAVNSFEYNTGIFIHEMGHIFGLLHTHQNNNSPNCERVTRNPNNPDYNANCAGDYVTDTQAMIDLNNNTALINSLCEYVGPQFSDCGGTPFIFDIQEIKNYMSYTLQHCRDRFTVGQGVRAREYLDNTPITQNYVKTPSEDLYTINSADDIGLEPDNETNVIWESPDIWVRNQPDGFTVQEHQDLEYIDDNAPVYVYVKVRNRGCESSGGNDTLELYWAKGGLNQTWPDVWTGLNNANNTFDIGNPVGSQAIPSLDYGDEVILEFQWQPKNPDAYESAGFNKPWMFCFLSRIVSSDDPMTFTETSNAGNNTRNNNNIAYKNTTVLNVSESSQIGSITAGNFSLSQPLTTDINFFTNQDNLIWEESEIRVTLNQELWEAWQDSGANSTNVRVISPNDRVIYLVGNNSSLNNITFDPNEWGILTPRINFLIREVTNETYVLNVSQTLSETDEILGGYTYHINRNISRQYFTADATVEVDSNNTILEAESINENATYNWYDEEGNFISSGETLSITNSNLKDYKLEVIADSDGHKDYKIFTVKEERNITNISPNPTISDITIYFKLGNANSAFLKLTNLITGSTDNYILDLSQNYKSINLSNMPSGQYIINLVTDNVIVDTKTIIKN